MEDKKEEKVDVKNEDVLEDIEDIEEIDETPTDNKSPEVILNDEIQDKETETEKKLDEPKEIDFNNEDNKSSKKSKTLIIVLLSILLFLDIMALVIYLVGIEKIINFIK